MFSDRSCASRVRSYVETRVCEIEIILWNVFWLLTLCVCAWVCVVCMVEGWGGGSTHYVRGIFSLRPVARTRGEGIFSLSK